MSNIGYLLSFIALSFSFTNFIYVSILPIFLLPLAIILIFYRKMVLPKYIATFILLTIYIVISTIFYDPLSFSEFEFYRRDGNFFITYGIFFTISMLGCARDPRRDLKIPLIIVMIASIIGFIFGHNEGGLVHFFLFEAHNAAGGFYGVMTALCLGFYLVNKSKFYMFSSFLFFFCLLMSDSRGTLLALILTLLYYFTLNFRRPLTIFLIFIFSQFIIVAWSYPIWIRSGKFISDEATFDGAVSLSGIERGGTVIDRVLYLWPRAVDNFINSPLLGMGFGSYDDLKYQYLSILPFFSIKIDQFVRHTDGHAHNSYLMILAELGIFGFLLYLLFFILLYIEIDKINSWAPDLSLALKFGLWVCLISSATEHRLTTPSQMIPFLILLALSICYSRFLKMNSYVYLEKRKK